MVLKYPLINEERDGSDPKYILKTRIGARLKLPHLKRRPIRLPLCDGRSTLEAL